MAINTDCSCNKSALCIQCSRHSYAVLWKPTMNLPSLSDTIKHSSLQRKCKNDSKKFKRIGLVAKNLIFAEYQIYFCWAEKYDKEIFQ